MSERKYRPKFFMRDGVVFEIDTDEIGVAEILATDFRQRRQRGKSLVINSRSGQKTIVNIAHVQVVQINEVPHPDSAADERREEN